MLIEDELNLDKLYSSTESTVKIHENGTSTLSKGQKRISTKELKNDIRKYLHKQRSNKNGAGGVAIIIKKNRLNSLLIITLII